MSDQHQFIITSLDLHTIDLEPFQHGGTNITGVRLIDPEDPVLAFTIKNWMQHEERRGIYICISTFIIVDLNYRTVYVIIVAT